MPSSAFTNIISHIPKNFADPEANYLQVRETMAPFHGHPTSPNLQCDMKDLGSVPCARYRLDSTPDDGFVALHIHGGALVSCPLDVYHFYAEVICRQTNMPTVGVDYRLAPEHTYPAAIDDCLNAYRGLLAEGVLPEKIVVLGESCGGGLALNALLLARDEGLPMPACFVSLTGWFDLSVRDTPTGADPFLTTGWVRNRGRDFAGKGMELDSPLISPCYADLQGLPPMYLQIGQNDTVAGGALRLANAATLAGVKVTIESWPDMIQGWHGLVTAGVPEAEQAWSAIRLYIDRELRPKVQKAEIQSMKLYL